MILTAVDGTIAFGAMPIEIDDRVNGFESITSTRDSRYLPDQASLTIKFNKLTNPPMGPPGPEDPIVLGDYSAHVFMSGYNDEGHAFLRTIDLGIVHITS